MGQLAPIPVAPAARGAILVVDDEVLIRLVMCEELRAAGYSVIEAASADEALGLLCAEVPADLLITDVRMPGLLDGLALSRAARIVRPELVIAVSSAHVPDAGSQPDGLIDEYLPKPYVASRLIAMVDRLLGYQV